MIKTISFIVVLVFCQLVHAGSVRLVNDSTYKLQAIVQASDGSSLGEVVVNPRQTMSWNDYNSGVGAYNQSRTPYTVQWYCMDGESFSTCSNVSPGGLTQAMSGVGPRACKVPKKGKKPFQDDDSFSDQQEQEDVGPPEGLLQ